ncbi:Crp/Fnr family transcriptional regulator [Mucilaginibacter sp. S1162]|uniref:Crp/Fnr family transcriptional regulator n=1 Tax=Mucilaginibacter humi TaxID=2732510 RepID=A0ABX1W6T9_9SPHI|nr:cyclic nucleotide-binding domain-containing protein [Mucilaginibacter humi]NNU34426.1 Crp/Fnr family transcriptional regulator [Mucilaginibacter humi]
MGAESLISYLSTMVRLTENYREALLTSAKNEIYQPHQIIHADGQRENRLWFLEQGFVRSYYFDHTGREHTLAFYDNKELVFSYEGFWNEPSDRYLEALQPSVLVSLTYTELREHLLLFSEAVVLKNIFVRQYEHQERFRKRLLTWKADERYRQTRKLQPELFRKASVRLIASYLNMTRENLSRLMAKNL